MPEDWQMYASSKPLASWISDFIERINFFKNWIENGQPKMFWITGFVNPKNFLTGVLQTFARKNKLPVD